MIAIDFLVRFFCQEKKELFASLKKKSGIMMKHTHIKAFTILEFLVVISLSSIVVTIAYMMWNRSLDSFSLYSESASEVNSLHRFKGAIEDDFFQSKNVVLSNNGFDCVLPNGELIEYSFSGGEMKRAVDNDEWVLEVEGFSIEMFLNSLKQKETNGLVDEIKLEFKMPNEKQSYLWRAVKQYGFSDFFITNN